MRNWVSSPSISELILRIYKGMAIRSNDLIARLYGVRGASWGIVIFMNGIVSEVQYK